MRKVLFSLVFLGALAPVAADAATYYVAKTGNDSYSCTQAQSQSTPRLTIQGGINCMASGDTLQIKAGTYARPSTNPPAGSSFSSPSTVQRYGSDVVVVKGWAAINSPSNQYIVLDGLVFDATGMGFNEVVYIDGGANHIRIVNSQVTGSGGTAGIALYGSGGYNQVLNSRIHHNGIDTAHDHGIYVHSPGNLIQGNELDNNAAAGIHFYNGGVDMGSGNVVTRNSLHDNSTGIVAWDTTGATISNNLLYNHASGQGISAKNASGLQVYNNSITGSGGYGIDLSNSSSVVIRNNIVYNNTVNINDLGSGTTKDHNLCNSGCNINGNPMFVSSTDLEVQSGSPAIDQGTTVASVTTDYAGAARPAGSAYDIGAYEFGASTTTQPPAPPSNLRVIW